MKNKDSKHNVLIFTPKQLRYLENTNYDEKYRTYRLSQLNFALHFRAKNKTEIDYLKNLIRMKK